MEDTLATPDQGAQLYGPNRRRGRGLPGTRPPAIEVGGLPGMCPTTTQVPAAFQGRALPLHRTPRPSRDAPSHYTGPRSLPGTCPPTTQDPAACQGRALLPHRSPRPPRDASSRRTARGGPTGRPWRPLRAENVHLLLPRGRTSYRRRFLPGGGNMVILDFLSRGV